jgi:hypothetical protein
VVDSNGKPVYNRAGEQSEEVLRHILDAALLGTASQEKH